MDEPSPVGLRRSILAMVDLLRRIRLRYMIIGGIAVGVWGRPRTTLDIDFAVLTNREGLERLGRLAERYGFRIDHQWAEWNPMARATQLRLIHRNLRIDLLLPADRHDRHALMRRHLKRWHHRRLWFVAPEDLILQKLKVGRPRDFEDALSIFEMQKGLLDKAYLFRWGKKLGITGELLYVMRGEEESI